MNYKALNPSKYLQAAVDMTHPLTLTIRHVEVVDMEGEQTKGQTEAPKKRKGVVWFSDHQLGWVMNVTNAFCLSEMFGKDTTTWHGKRVTIHSEMVQSFGKTEPGIRITGSPDIAKDMSVELKLRKKKTQVFMLKKTGGAPAANASPPKPPTNPSFAALQALATLNQIPWPKVAEWLKARGRTNGASVTAEDVAAYKAVLDAEPMPAPEDQPF